MDTPEIAKPQSDQPAEPWAAEAAALTASLIDGGSVRLRLEPHLTRGEYGRLLAYVELPDGTLLNERLLLAGLAKAEGRWSHLHVERFALLENQARRDRVGLWSKTND